MARISGLLGDRAPQKSADFSGTPLAKGERLEAMGLLGDLASIIDSAVKQEAVSALVMLGFAAAASGKVVDKILKAAPESSVEQVIKQALKML